MREEELHEQCATGGSDGGCRVKSTAICVYMCQRSYLGWVAWLVAAVAAETPTPSYGGRLGFKACSRFSRCRAINCGFYNVTPPKVRCREPVGFYRRLPSLSDLTTLPCGSRHIICAIAQLREKLACRSVSEEGNCIKMQPFP